MVKSLVRMIFGCAHSRTTFPLTPTRSYHVPGRARNGTYIVCLDCGKEFDYNWQEMRVGTPIREVPAPVAELRAEQRIAHCGGAQAR
jgi:hypothetical protein